MQPNEQTIRGLILDQAENMLREAGFSRTLREYFTRDELQNLPFCELEVRLDFILDREQN